ncbi:LOW QUALITY PROTEIN: nuclear respiratory factor 1-like [Ciona intestinalis]
MDSNFSRLLNLPVNLSMMSGNELEDDESFSASELLHSSAQDGISSSLVNTGTMPGLAAAAALVTSRKRHQPYSFELNPSIRKRQYNRLLRKLKQTIHELCTRCGQQAVVLCVSPGKENGGFRVIGSSPLDSVVKNCKSAIYQELEQELQEKLGPKREKTSDVLCDLPELLIEGIPTPVEKMNQAQLRMFIPEMLKHATGRGKPGWGKESTRPVWWPLDVPWANVRRDVRSPEVKIRVSWTQALRQIVKNCYRFHAREDLLVGMECEADGKNETGSPRDRQNRSNYNSPLSPPTLVQTVHNADGSVSLVQLDSGQTIATITQDQSGTAVATLTGQQMAGEIDMAMDDIEHGDWSRSMTRQSVKRFNAIATSHQEVVSQQKNDLSLTFDPDQEIMHNVPLSEPDNVTMADDDESSSLVQIPVSVYEKLASSIQRTSNHATVSMSPNGTIHLQTSVKDSKPLDVAQESSKTKRPER